MKKLISIPWAHWTQAVILPDKDLHWRGLFTEQAWNTPLCEKVDENFLQLLVCKHNMSLVFQRAGKKESQQKRQTQHFRMR